MHASVRVYRFIDVGSCLGYGSVKCAGSWPSDEEEDEDEGEGLGGEGGQAGWGVVEGGGGRRRCLGSCTVKLMRLRRLILERLALGWVVFWL